MWDQFSVLQNPPVLAGSSSSLTVRPTTPHQPVSKAIHDTSLSPSERLSKRRRRDSNTWAENALVQKPQGIDRLQWIERTPEEAALFALQQLYGAAATFKSDGQKDALIRVLRKKKNLLIILPPRLGKSLMFMAPAVLPQARTTVVIIPYKALINDIEVWCKYFKILHQVWYSSIPFS
jgi:superfamily II DNA helicase RecQ